MGVSDQFAAPILQGDGRNAIIRAQPIVAAGGIKCYTAHMKWVDNIKASARESAEAFREWGRMLTVIGIVIAASLVAIAIELLVICIKM